MREEYVSPVGFAAEPEERRRHWILRIATIALVIAIGYIFVTHVWHVQDNNSGGGGFPAQQSNLPAPG
jgi:hypothetical protein